MILIGLTGLIGSGKNTVANLLKTHGFEQDSYANSLKDVVASLFNWPRHLLEGDTDESRQWREEVDHWWARKLKIPNFTPRYAIQYVGTEVIRNNLHTDMWMFNLESRLQNRTGNLVITDCRFRNEVDLIKKHDGYIVKVVNGELPSWWKTAIDDEFFMTMVGTDSKRLMPVLYPEVHESEYQLVSLTPDFIIRNDGSLDQLSIIVDQLIDQLK